MKKKKFSTGLISGILIGIFGGLLLSPNQRDKIKDTLTYRIKKMINDLYNFLGYYVSKSHPKNIAKDRSQKIITNTKTKAKMVLNDIKEMTKK